MISARRLAERGQHIAALGPRPRWWRFIARRRWDRRRAAIMTMDVTTFAEIIADNYPLSAIEAAAAHPYPFLATIAKGPRR